MTRILHAVIQALLTAIGVVVLLLWVPWMMAWDAWKERE